LPSTLTPFVLGGVAGNADIVVAKQTYKPGSPVLAREFRNWDGSSSVSTEPFVREAASALFPAAVEALTALLGDSERRDFAVTIEDPAIADSDE
jgi:hypothetical protein